MTFNSGVSRNCSTASLSSRITWLLIALYFSGLLKVAIWMPSSWDTSK